MKKNIINISEIFKLKINLLALLELNNTNIQPTFPMLLNARNFLILEKLNIKREDIAIEKTPKKRKLLYIVDK